jgi:hypothetical protein
VSARVSGEQFTGETSGQSARRGPSRLVVGAIVAVLLVAISIPTALYVSRSKASSVPENVFGNGDVFTCSSASWCVSEDTSVTEQAPTLIETPSFWSWDGRSWSRMPVAAPLARITTATFNGAACNTDRECVAVGTYEGNACAVAYCPQALAAHWNGVSWVQSPLGSGVGGSAQLDSVACPSPTDCVAVGATSEGALVENWNGRQWKEVSNPLALGSGDGFLQSVSCSNMSFCVAVGVGFGDPYKASLLRHLISAKALAGARRAAALSAVTAIEQWNGRRWTARLIPFPHQPAAEGSSKGFDEVACAGVMMCAATGTYSPGVSAAGDTIVATAFDQWNGHSWRESSWPPFAAAASQPLISCRPDWCLAAYFTTARSTGSDYAAIETAVWKGKWEAEPAIRVPAFFVPYRIPIDPWTMEPFEYGFSCGSARVCIGGGRVLQANEAPCGNSESYAARWNGAAWTVEITGRRSPPNGCQ